MSCSDMGRRSPFACLTGKSPFLNRCDLRMTIPGRQRAAVHHFKRDGFLDKIHMLAEQGIETKKIRDVFC
jgi:hypothetical protein